MVRKLADNLFLLASPLGYDGGMGELTDVFVELLSNNRGPGYGVKVIDAAKDLSRVDVEIVFVAGRTYCCAEPGCHLPRDSKRLMKLAAVRSISIPERAMIKWHFRIEAGARLECHHALGMPLESRAYQFDVVGLPPKDVDSATDKLAENP